MKTLTSLLVAALLTGCGAPATVQPEAVPSPVTVSDDLANENWQESETDPSGIRGLTVGELIQDAWATEGTEPLNVPDTRYAFVPEYAGSFDGSAPGFDQDYLVVESHQFPGVFHAFHVVAAKRV